MIASLQFTIINVQCSMNGQLSITNVATRKIENGKCMVNGKWLMVNDSKGVL